MKVSGIFISLVLLFSVTEIVCAETGWVNNITVNEYNITWSYTETLTGMDSISYRINLDSKIGNNDSFINAWELLKADKDSRQKFKNSLENEFDIKINNETSGIELIDVDSSLSQAIIGKTHLPDTIENRYYVTYRLKESIYNDSSIWFLGQPKSPVSIILPQGIDIFDISGMDNETRNIDSSISGYFSNLSKNRAEITINISKNASYNLTSPEANITEVVENNENSTKPVSEVSTKIRKWSIIGVGIVFIVLIYVFKVRKN
ncbi:MAG: hypothetical protein OIN83_03510 [Candidatus Methanoperedens sp.]|nr:hypothetical protein [Candidatus Methanoperedens sp.]